jgi:hypothetical protein
LLREIARRKLLSHDRAKVDDRARDRKRTIVRESVKRAPRENVAMGAPLVARSRRTRRSSMCR